MACLCKKLTFLANLSNFEEEYNHKGVEIDKKDCVQHFSFQEPLRALAAGASEELSCGFGSSKYFALCAFGELLGRFSGQRNR